MYFIGLMGNIASGKSAAVSFFKEQAITTISADEVARELVAAKQPALAQIATHFGSIIIGPSGELDRQALRDIIFANPQERLWLEELLHPLIRKTIKEKVFNSTSPYTIIEIPLLKAREDYPFLNRVLIILASSQRQLERLRQRDKVSREQAMAILAAQPDLASRMNLADDVVLNDGNLADLEKKIKKMHQYYLQLARQAS